MLRLIHRRKLLGAVLVAFLAQATPPAQAQSTAEPTVRTGIAVGTKIPHFELTDHRGKRQTFETLRGPKGLLLLFHRSADW